MAFMAQKQTFSGKIREVTIGGDGSSVKIGGENTLPFHGFEGQIPNKPLIAMEVWDEAPSNWPEALIKNYEDVKNDPAAWAKKCVEQYGADLISLHLVSTDPNGTNRSVDDAAETVKAVLAAVSVPLIIFGGGNLDKDAEVLKKVSEVAQGKNVLLGQAQEENYKSITAAAMGYKQNIVSATPIDVNLAKQLNILISNLGLPLENVVMGQCSTGALGYGLEYAYSVMERDKLAALQQNDATMQVPLLANLGVDAWKAKEAKTSEADMPAWGDAEKRGIIWEALTAMAYLISGANVLIMRHPQSAALVKKAVDSLS
jgi:acetyl-CoA decarbonylase/synthase complex subunit delta